MGNLIKRGAAAPAAGNIVWAKGSHLNPSASLARYRAAVALDRHALDIAAEEQPQLYLEIAEERVHARSRHDAAKDNLTRTDARLGRETRAKMEKESIKPTEGRIADVVLGHEEHLAAADAAAKAKEEADEWDALVSAFEHRKSMIRELATLYASGYYTAGAADKARGQVRDTGAAAGREALHTARQARSER